MPGDAVDSGPVSALEQPAAELRDLVSDLSQYLEYQKSLGLTHVVVQDQNIRTMAAWGTSAWKQHRFISQGPDNARIVIVDSKGSFFGGKSGRLLVNILKAMHLTPEQVFICNAADLAHIRSRVSAAPPAAVITLGEKACRLVLGENQPFDAALGRFHAFCGTKVMPARHPEELLADPGLKRGVWNSMQQVMAEAGLGHDR